MTALNKEEIALVPTKRSTPSRVKRSYEAQLEACMTTDVITFETRSSVVEATEIESETVGVITERGKLWQERPDGRTSAECTSIRDETDQCNSSVPKIHKETPGRMPLLARLFYLRTGGTLREGLPHIDE